MINYPDNPHQLALFLYRELQDVTLLGDKRISGTVPSGWNWDKLEDALSSNYIFDSINEVQRIVIFNYPSLFIDKFQELLDSGEYCKKAPDHFYLMPENYAYPDPDEPPIVSSYKKALKLIELMKKIADYAVPTHSPDTLVFIGKNKLELEIKFNSEQLLTFGSFCSLD
ncbi:hypothetical protein QE250_16630, partial [Chromatiaceae bacterium AAb-1]|nr:hypothetical protein [Chromatiaceae bacterium AAb-1]